MSTSRREDSDTSSLVALATADPCLDDGFRVLFERELSIEVRRVPDYCDEEDIDEAAQLEPICVRIFQKGKDSNPESIRIDISSENDIFFYFSCSLNSNEFLSIAKSQSLQMSFSQLGSVLICNLNSCIKTPHKHMVILNIRSDGAGRMRFMNNISDFKFVELFSLPVSQAPTKTAIDIVSYRYNMLKSRLCTYSQMLHNVLELVKKRDESLFVELQQISSLPDNGI